MSGKLPSLSGPELIDILLKNGWTEHGKRTHGLALKKKQKNGRTLVTIIPTKSGSLPKGTRGAILGPLQTKIGTKGLLKLLGQ